MISPIETQLKTHVADFLARHVADKNADQKPIAVALSGGIESMVLLDILHHVHLTNPTPGVPFGMEAPMRVEAIHVNHHISPNAKNWANFCVAECQKRGGIAAIVDAESRGHSARA